jgi:hypothetical protein
MHGCGKKWYPGGALEEVRAAMPCEMCGGADARLCSDRESGLRTTSWVTLAPAMPQPRWGQCKPLSVLLPMPGIS